jgi:beta-glucosidase
MLQWFAQRAASFEIRDRDMTTIATPIDFLGINVYHPDWVQAAERQPLELEPAQPPPPHSPLGWQIDPGNLREILDRLASAYDAPPVWITENGICDDATAPLHERLHDDARIGCLAGHLQALAGAIADGADVRRYFVWSLLDSFEWELGYGAPFGLIHVDPTTQARTPKRSAHWYRDFIARARSARPL